MFQHDHHTTGNFKTWHNFKLIASVQSPCFCAFEPDSFSAVQFTELHHRHTNSRSQATHVALCFVFRNAGLEQRKVEKLRCLHLVLDRMHIQPSQSKLLGPQVPKTLLKNCLVQTLQGRKKENPLEGTSLMNILKINPTFFKREGKCIPWT